MTNSNENLCKARWYSFSGEVIHEDLSPRGREEVLAELRDASPHCMAIVIEPDKRSGRVTAYARAHRYRGGSLQLSPRYQMVRTHKLIVDIEVVEAQRRSNSGKRA